MHSGKVLVKIRENQHREFQPGSFHFKLCILESALLLLKLKLRLDSVGVGDLTAALEFLGDIEEVLRLTSRTLCRRILALCDHRSVVGRRDYDHEATSRNL